LWIGFLHIVRGGGYGFLLVIMCDKALGWAHYQTSMLLLVATLGGHLISGKATVHGGGGLNLLKTKQMRKRYNIEWTLTSLSHPSPLLTKKWCFWYGSLIHHMTGCLDFPLLFFCWANSLPPIPLSYTLPIKPLKLLCTSFLFSTLRASPMVLSMWPCEMIFHIQV
jgi:hypothetical protein